MLVHNGKHEPVITTWKSFLELAKTSRAQNVVEVYCANFSLFIHTFVRSVVRSFEAIELMIIGTGLWLMFFFLSLCDCLLYVAQTQIQSARFEAAAQCNAKRSG